MSIRQGASTDLLRFSDDRIIVSQHGDMYWESEMHPNGTKNRVRRSKTQKATIDSQETLSDSDSDVKVPEQQVEAAMALLDKAAFITVLVVIALLASGAYFSLQHWREMHRDPCDFWTDNPYAILDLPFRANATQIKSSYKKWSLLCHPDKNLVESRKSIVQEGFVKIKESYDILMDPDERAIVNRCGVGGVKQFRYLVQQDVKGLDLAKVSCEVARSYEAFGDLGRQLFLAGFKSRDLSAWVKVYHTCGEEALGLYEHKFPARDACAWYKVYKQCGGEALGLYQHKIPARDACAWYKVYTQCGGEGLSLFKAGFYPANACSELRFRKSHRDRVLQSYVQSSYNHFDPFGGYDPLAHLRQHHQPWNPHGHYHHGFGHHHHGFGHHGMPFW